MDQISVEFNLWLLRCQSLTASRRIGFCSHLGALRVNRSGCLEPSSFVTLQISNPIWVFVAHKRIVEPCGRVRACTQRSKASGKEGSGSSQVQRARGGGKRYACWESRKGGEKGGGGRIVCQVCLGQGEKRRHFCPGLVGPYLPCWRIVLGSWAVRCCRAWKLHARTRHAPCIYCTGSSAPITEDRSVPGMEDASPIFLVRRSNCQFKCFGDGKSISASHESFFHWVQTWCSSPIRVQSNSNFTTGPHPLLSRRHLQNKKNTREKATTSSLV